ncbi:response regulator [Comamonas endophytica]|uniref:histidine kinase n=1 Tax=Comamonas endophytica TaxID=2949090 RepID=A0ABY6G6K2_9BURK|nr:MULTISPECIES: response regulator [unclassified Acidovorax]MCD2511257.1 response regulator [Acidovorax sp. D4N7]UYG50653.1 response regulator [Acidovorax sp. 5MLIR]
MPPTSARLNVSIDRSQHTVLVVDDNPVTCYATSRSLRAAGFRTIEAGTGQGALDLSLGDISAVVLDVHLPDIGGFEVCRMMREREATSALPIVHLSAAFIADADKIAGLDAGADAYLTHPAEPAMLVATIQALVRARLAEDRVRQSEAKFRSIYEQAQSGIALIDDGGRFVDANPAMLEMMGRSAEEVLGRPVADFSAPGHEQHIQALSAAQNVQSMWREEVVFLDASGQLLHLEWSMAPSVNGELRVAAVSNVSNRIQLEEERRQLLEREQAARAAAERYSRSKDDFVAVLSHELRNPLSAIMMNVHQLLRKAPPAEFARSLDAIKRNASTQARIISDILDVSRINSGKLALEREWIEPDALISSSLDSLKAMMEAKQLRLRLETQTRGVKAFLDPARFQQIFWNILNNAIKFSSEGGLLEVSLSATDNQLLLSVRDHGKGIEAAFMDRIFEKFTQAATPGSRTSGGLGLGLSIVKHLVDLHSGDISVSSPGLGLGTTVSVTLPLGLAAEGQAASPDADMAAVMDGAQELQGLRILVVEDDTEAANLLALILQERGATVSMAGDYDTAVALLDRHGADVLVSDIGLPGKDGYELIRDVRASKSGHAGLPAIALTAFGRATDKQLAMDAGFDFHLAKPLQPQKLLDAIRSLMARPARQDEARA